MICLFLKVIYIVHDANIRQYFYIASDILIFCKKSTRKWMRVAQKDIICQVSLFVYLNTG